MISRLCEVVKGVLNQCVEVNEACLKRSIAIALGCVEEARVCEWRSDLKCGDRYIEVEPIERILNGLCQAAAWRHVCGVQSLVLTYGSRVPEWLPKLASKISVNVIFIHVKDLSILTVSSNGNVEAGC